MGPARKARGVAGRAVNQHAVGLRRGQLLAGLEGARAMLKVAERSWDLLSDEDRKRLRDIVDALGGIEQRQWKDAR